LFVFCLFVCLLRIFPPSINIRVADVGSVLKSTWQLLTFTALYRCQILVMGLIRGVRDFTPVCNRCKIPYTPDQTHIMNLFPMIK
jgi:hypothetical protein